MSFTNPLTLFCASLLALLGTVPFTPFPSATLRVDVIAGVDPVSATRFVGAGVRGTDWCTALSEEVHSPQLSTPNIGNAQTASARSLFMFTGIIPLLLSPKIIVSEGERGV